MHFLTEINLQSKKLQVKIILREWAILLQILTLMEMNSYQLNNLEHRKNLLVKIKTKFKAIKELIKWLQRRKGRISKKMKLNNKVWKKINRLLFFIIKKFIILLLKKKIANIIFLKKKFKRILLKIKKLMYEKIIIIIIVI